MLYYNGGGLMWMMYVLSEVSLLTGRVMHKWLLYSMLLGRKWSTSPRNKQRESHIVTSVRHVNHVQVTS
jgi:hypothetical protein